MLSAANIGGLAPVVGARNSFKDCIARFGPSPASEDAWRRRRQMAIVELAALRQAGSDLFANASSYSRFLELYALARDAHPNELAAVLGSPYSFVWLRRIFDCV